MSTKRGIAVSPQETESAAQLSLDLVIDGRQPRTRVVPDGLRKESDRLPQELVPPYRAAVHGTHREAAICAAALAGTAELALDETVSAHSEQAASGDPVFAGRCARHPLNPPMRRRRPDWMTDWTEGVQLSGKIEPEARNKAVTSIPANRWAPDSPSASQRLE